MNKPQRPLPPSQATPPQLRHSSSILTDQKIAHLTGGFERCQLARCALPHDAPTQACQGPLASHRSGPVFECVFVVCRCLPWSVCRLVAIEEVQSVHTADIGLNAADFKLSLNLPTMSLTIRSPQHHTYMYSTLHLTNQPANAPTSSLCAVMLSGVCQCRPSMHIASKRPSSRPLASQETEVSTDSYALSLFLRARPITACRMSAVCG